MFGFNKQFPLLVNLETRNKTLSWYSTDDEWTFEKNRRKKGKGWLWANSSIEYKFNSLGYRSKEIDEVDDNFILGFGCSYTEGVGIHEKDIWLTKISKKLNMDYINLAKQGTGCDVQAYNAMLWKNSNLRKPKMVICQWPQEYRLQFPQEMTTDETGDWINLKDESHQKTDNGKWWERSYIQNPGFMRINMMHWFNSFNTVWESLGVPVVNFTWETGVISPLQFSTNVIHFIDPGGVGSTEARDCQHDSSKFHANTVRELLKIL